MKVTTKINKAFADASKACWTEGARIYYNFSGEYCDVLWMSDAAQAKVARRGMIADRVADVLDLQQSTRRHLVRTAERTSLAKAKAELQYILN